MIDPTRFCSAIGEDWMAASRVHPFLFDDPAQIWLEFHGHRYQLEPDRPPYGFLDFVAEKGQQFEERWFREMAPEAVRVCTTPDEVRWPERVRETLALMQQTAPAIAQAALWLPQERIYGVPDLLVHTSWLSEHFPHLLAEMQEAAPLVVSGHYVVFELKFATCLDTAEHRRERASYEAQVRLYSYILGQLQGTMPTRAYLVTRDTVLSPLTVRLSSELHAALDPDLATIRDRFVEIQRNIFHYLPWVDEQVAPNYQHHDERWRTARQTIAHDKVPGGSPEVLPYIGKQARLDLAALGYASLASLTRTDPNTVPFEQCSGIGESYARQIRAILQANRLWLAIPPHASAVPVPQRFEFFVDFEYFTNVNVDVEHQWPSLEGCEMIFLVGVGWVHEGEWHYRQFVAAAETHAAERAMLDSFLEFLDSQTGGLATSCADTALYHWTSAEVWQSRRAAERHHLPDDHPLRHLPWDDLHRVCTTSACGFPGAWGYQLKEVARSLRRLNPAYDPHWPGDLDSGLSAMVMGWRAYQHEHPLATPEMYTLSEYLQADCRALWKILSWMRAQTS